MKITYAELMKEVERLRGRKNGHNLTKEQVKFIKSCRSGVTVPYSLMVELWDKMDWGKLSIHSMKRLYEKVQRESK
jgi:hypothetical protein